MLRLQDHVPMNIQLQEHGQQQMRVEMWQMHLKQLMWMIQHHR